MPTLHAPPLINLNRLDYKNPPHLCDNVGKGQLGFHILASTLWTLRFYPWVLMQRITYRPMCRSLRRGNTMSVARGQTPSPEVRVITSVVLTKKTNVGIHAS